MCVCVCVCVVMHSSSNVVIFTNNHGKSMYTFFLSVMAYITMALTHEN